MESQLVHISATPRRFSSILLIALANILDFLFSTEGPQALLQCDSALIHDYGVKEGQFGSLVLDLGNHLALQAVLHCYIICVHYTAEPLCKNAWVSSVLKRRKPKMLASVKPYI